MRSPATEKHPEMWGFNGCKQSDRHRKNEVRTQTKRRSWDKRKLTIFLVWIEIQKYPLLGRQGDMFCSKNKNTSEMLWPDLGVRNPWGKPVRLPGGGGIFTPKLRVRVWSYAEKRVGHQLGCYKSLLQITSQIKNCFSSAKCWPFPMTWPFSYD